MKGIVLVLVAACLLMATVFAAENDVVMSSYNYEPSPVEAGQTFELWIHVVNNSAKTTNALEATSDFEYPFSLPENEDRAKFLGALVPQGTALVNYEYVKVDPNTPSGEYKFEFKVGPKNGVGRNYFVKVKVTQKKPDVELIGVEFKPAILKPGLENAKARLRLKNLGKTPAYDLKAIMDATMDGATGTGSEGVKQFIKQIGSPLSYLPVILSGEEKEVELQFSVDRDADLKTYLIPIRFEYKNENNAEFSFERQIGAEVTDNADLDVVLVAVDPPAVLGKTSKISVDVFNAGGATANYVVAEPYSEAAAKIIPEKVFIGTLEPDDFDSFTFQAQFKDGLPAGIQPLQIRLYYRDKGVRKELPNKTLTVNIYTQAEANALQKQELPVGPLVVLLVLGTFLFRKRLAKLLGSFGKKDAEA